MMKMFRGIFNLFNKKLTRKANLCFSEDQIKEIWSGLDKDLKEDAKFAELKDVMQKRDEVILELNNKAQLNMTSSEKTVDAFILKNKNEEILSFLPFVRTGEGIRENIIVKDINKDETGLLWIIEASLQQHNVDLSLFTPFASCLKEKFKKKAVVKDINVQAIALDVKSIKKSKDFDDAFLINLNTVYDQNYLKSSLVKVDHVDTINFLNKKIFRLFSKLFYKSEEIPLIVYLSEGQEIPESGDAFITDLWMFCL